MDLQLTGKAGLVTGSTRGIGKAIALRLAEEGCAVGISGRTRATLDVALGEMWAHQPTSVGFELDLLPKGGAERFVDDTAAALGRLDVVVANVGGTVGGNFLETDPDDWVKTYELNTVLAVRTIRAAVPHLEKTGGSVVVIASISGSRPGPRAQYGAAKAAELSFVTSLARELAPKRIRINAVSPGSIMWEGGSWHRRQQAMPERLAEFIATEFPLGRMGTLNEVADVAAFLASPRASWINGANIVVDGAQGNPSIRLT